ncbi:sensor histidine kinase [Actinosynnema sp. NPDC059335]|uniref:sensor histidine kinase n=1 Tax=Actinosynnema sp. NPDC059335 TaxID=3346804 RepID=UPI003670D341
MRDAVKWLLFGSVFVLIFVPRAVYETAVGDGSTPRKVLGISLLTAYSVGWLLLPLLWRLEHRDDRRTAACLALTALGLVTVAVLGLDAATLMIYVMATTAMALPTRRAVVVNGAVLVGLAVAMAVTGDLPDDVDQLGTVFSVTLGMGAMGRALRANRELRRAQEEIAALAVVEERNRLARDLHDVLGHSLTTITLKAGLARRLLERDDPGRAREEVRDIETLTRQALGDVRATVSGYREVSLSAELVGARAALRAAGIEADLPHAVDNVHPDLQRVFGHVLREGVTNVLRHSAATRCEVRLGDTWLEVRDNGRGRGTGVPGTGLAGLADRLAEVGGTVEAGPAAGGGYRLRAEVA